MPTSNSLMTQWIKDPALSVLQLSWLLCQGFDFLAQEISHAVVEDKKKKKKKTTSSSMINFYYSLSIKINSDFKSTQVLLLCDSLSYPNHCFKSKRAYLFNKFVTICHKKIKKFTNKLQ